MNYPKLDLFFFLNKGTLFSVPLNNLVIFFWWVRITKNATIIANKRYKVSFSSNMNKINTIKATPANMELKDTKRVVNKVKANTTKQSKATAGCIANAIPKMVATPFPPLKPAQIGKICPTTAASPNIIMKLVLANSFVK